MLAKAESMAKGLASRGVPYPAYPARRCALPDGIEQRCAPLRAEQFGKSFRPSSEISRRRTTAVAITWELNQLARARIYQALRIPVEPCEPEVNSCVHVPGGPVALDDACMNKAATIAGEQLAKAGFRLASLLDDIWPSNTMIRNYAPAQ